MSALDVSVVIVNRDGRHLLATCLPAVAPACAGLAHEVIVVDNGSTDASREPVEAAAAAWLPLGENRGYAVAVNAGLARARGRHWVVMNNDVVLAPGAVAAAVLYMDRTPEVGIAGFKLLNPDGSLQPSGRRAPRLAATVLAHWRLVGESYREAGRDYDRVAAVEEVSGACLIARAALAESVGPMDEGFFFYYEDVDWCARVRAAGLRVVYLPEAVAVHAWGATSQGAGWVKAVGRASMLRYFRRHSGLLGAWFLKCALLPLDLARFVRVRSRADLSIAWRMLVTVPPASARLRTAPRSLPR